jgi:plastocyanin
MRTRFSLALLALVGVAGACGGDSNNDGGPSGPGPVNGPAGTVTVGNIFFKSGHNGTQNPAVDTVSAGTTVTWTWTNTGNTSHSVRSEGAPSFTSSSILTGAGMTYTFTFDTPGTYHYDCDVHGSAMSGTVVVQ